MNDQEHIELSRRDFITYGAAGVAASLTAGTLSTSAADAESSGDAGARTGDGVKETTILELQQSMASGERTARFLTEAYLERIEEIDSAGPSLNSVLALNPDALDIASALDRERQERGPRGALHGIPVLLKDNLETGDRMATTAGSLALAGSVAARDSFVAERLRGAGCVLLGKANLSEWANFRSSRSTSGWSGVGGQTRNPYALDRNPCGSSSGSGASVAASLCAAAIGTETDGSVVCPANANGIVGIKPTLGLVSRAGIVPLAHSQDTAGTMGRTVADATAMLTAIAGADSRDDATAASAQHPADFAAFLLQDGLQGARLGVARNYTGFHEKCEALLEDALAAMRSAGARVIDPIELPHRGDYGDAEYEVLLYEFKADLNNYLAQRPSVQVKSLADLIDFNRSLADAEMPYFQQEVFEEAQEKGDLTEAPYQEALEKCKRLAGTEGIDAALKKDGLDAIVAITGGPAWLTDLVIGDHFLGGCSQPAAVAGYPHVTVPMGYVFGLPVNISFLSTAWSEPTLIRIAYAFEQLTQHRQAPRFLQTVNLNA
ncbi:MAG: amidase [Candidatus Latescibacterota bacterium]|nr:amidase [Candidatus Latescibacterota bacterium]